MARKPQISINVDRAVKRWILDTERREDSTKTRIGLCGLIMYIAADKRVQEEVGDLAAWLDRGWISWEDVEDYADATEQSRVKIVVRLRQKAMKAEPSAGDVRGEHAAERVKEAAGKSPSIRRRRT